MSVSYWESGTKKGLEPHFTIPIVVLHLSHDLFINTHAGIYVVDCRVCKVLFFFFFVDLVSYLK